MYERTDYIEPRDIEYVIDTLNIFKTPENSDYKLELVVEREEFILQILPQKTGEEIKATKFIIQVDNPRIGFREGNLHFLKTREKTLEVQASAFSN